MTSSINSKVPSCNITIHPVPTTKPIKIDRAVRTENVVAFIDTAGRIYCNNITNRLSYPSDWKCERHTALFACLVKLGLISKADVAAHDRAVNEIRKRKNNASRAEMIIEHANQIGLKLTAAQHKTIEAFITAKK